MNLKPVKRFFLFVALLIVAVVVAQFGYQYYSFIFSKRVKGMVQSIERIDLSVSLLQQTGDDNKMNPQLFSFAVAVKEKSGEIIASSAEDRQWAVVQKGQCVEALFYPYPPWNVMKAGTYFNARLDRIFECDSKDFSSSVSAPSK